MGWNKRILLARCVDSRSDFLELPEENGGNVILYVLVSFHTGDVFWTLSRLFVLSGISFVFLLFWLFIILPFIRF